MFKRSNQSKNTKNADIQTAVQAAPYTVNSNQQSYNTYSNQSEQSINFLNSKIDIIFNVKLTQLVVKLMEIHPHIRHQLFLQRYSLKQLFQIDPKNILIHETQKEILIINKKQHIKSGKGCFGAIFKGVMLTAQGQIKKVAAKMFIMKQQEYMREGYIIQFKRQLLIYQEITKSQRKSENVLTYYTNFNDTQKNSYLVFEYVQNIRILDLIRNKKIIEAEIFDILLQLAHALYYLQYQAFLTHPDKTKLLNNVESQRDSRKYFQKNYQEQKNVYQNLGVIFRDLKPDNILCYRDEVTSRLKIKICDFGVSRIANVAERCCFTQCGTMIYTSPQNSNQSGYSGKIDVWSFGVLLVQLLNPYFSKRVDKIKKQEVYKVVLQLKPECYYKQLEYKRIWMEMINNCLASQQENRWSICQLKQFMQEKIKNRQIQVIDHPMTELNLEQLQKLFIENKVDSKIQI